MVPASPTPWTLFIATLPTSSPAARMRLWRALKSMGAAALRDGAYLMPDGPATRQAFAEFADQCTAEGGSAWVVRVEPIAPSDDAAWRSLFDRAEDYERLRRAWKQARDEAPGLSAADLGRQLRRLQRELDALRAIDFFPGDAATEADAAWIDLRRHLEALISPDEPRGSAGPLPRLDAAQFQGRLWATRRRLWVDRVASAWLIARFIDRDACFAWLAHPADCPADALGFDFDGATFTHVGERVTFETLVDSFGLGDDPGLRRLAALVHQLDVGGPPVPEAAGFEAVLAGARERLPDDDRLLAEMGPVLDSLHAHFSRDATRAAS